MLWRLVCAGATILLITGAADAQSNDGQSSFGVPFKSKAPLTQDQIEQQKATDKAYQDAVRKVPDKKSSADPWSDVRPAKTRQQ
jgi:hypothetical protein